MGNVFTIWTHDGARVEAGQSIAQQDGEWRIALAVESWDRPPETLRLKIAEVDENVAGEASAANDDCGHVECQVRIFSSEAIRGASGAWATREYWEIVAPTEGATPALTPPEGSAAPRPNAHRFALFLPRGREGSTGDQTLEWIGPIWVPIRGSRAGSGREGAGYEIAFTFETPGGERVAGSDSLFVRLPLPARSTASSGDGEGESSSEEPERPGGPPAASGHGVTLTVGGRPFLGWFNEVFRPAHQGEHHLVNPNSPSGGHYRYFPAAFNAEWFDHFINNASLWAPNGRMTLTEFLAITTIVYNEQGGHFRPQAEISPWHGNWPEAYYFQYNKNTNSQPWFANSNHRVATARQALLELLDDHTQVGGLTEKQVWEQRSGWQTLAPGATFSVHRYDENGALHLVTSSPLPATGSDRSVTFTGMWNGRAVTDRAIPVPRASDGSWHVKVDRYPYPPGGQDKQREALQCDFVKYRGHGYMQQTFRYNLLPYWPSDDASLQSDGLGDLEALTSERFDELIVTDPRVYMGLHRKFMERARTTGHLGHANDPVPAFQPFGDFIGSGPYPAFFSFRCVTLLLEMTQAGYTFEGLEDADDSSAPAGGLTDAFRTALWAANPGARDAGLHCDVCNPDPPADDEAEE